MKEDIKHLMLNAEFYTQEGCYITEVSNTPDDPGLSIARARVEPGVTTRWHRLHGITERYYIIQGKGIMEVGELPPQEVTAGDVVLIPPAVPSTNHQYRHRRFDLSGYLHAPVWQRCLRRY